MISAINYGILLFHALIALKSIIMEYCNNGDLY